MNLNICFKIVEKESAHGTHSWDAVSEIWSKSASSNVGALSSGSCEESFEERLKKALNESSSALGTDTLMPSGVSSGEVQYKN